MDVIAETLTVPSSRAIVAFCGCLLLIGMIEILLVQSIIKRNRIKWLGVNPQVLSLVRRPIYLQIFVWSSVWSMQQLDPDAGYIPTVTAILYTVNYIVWASTISSLGQRILIGFSRMTQSARFIDEQTVGIFLIGLRVLVWTLVIYLCFMAWSIDLTGWLASAGAIGIVLGFAAKDTLANLVSGLAILADHSYKVGDFVEIDNRYRGRVIRIGIRATLLHTAEGIQIAIPNSLLANGYVVNETAGPSASHRLSIPISVAYGSDLEHSVAVIRSAIEDLTHLVRAKDTRVLVRSLGESGIDIVMMVWINDPTVRDLVIDEALRRAYIALDEAGITIPFNQLDVHLVQEKVDTPSIDA